MQPNTSKQMAQRMFDDTSTRMATPAVLAQSAHVLLVMATQLLDDCVKVRIAPVDALRELWGPVMRSDCAAWDTDTPTLMVLLGLVTTLIGYTGSSTGYECWCKNN